MPPSGDLSAVVRQLGASPRARADAAKTLQEQGEAGLEALLAVWEQEQQRRIRQSRIGLAMVVTILPVASALSWHRGFAWQMLSLLAFFLSLIWFPRQWEITELQRQILLVLATYDNERVMRPLAEGIWGVAASTYASPLGTDSPLFRGRQAALTALSPLLQRQPGFRARFSGGYSVRWAPGRVYSRYRRLFVWCSNALLYGLVMGSYRALVAHPPDVSFLVLCTLLMPLISMLESGERRRQEVVPEVAFERTSVTPLLTKLAAVAALVFLTGALTHAIAGHLSWAQIAVACVVYPMVLWLRELLDRVAVVTPEPPAALDTPTSGQPLLR